MGESTVAVEIGGVRLVAHSVAADLTLQLTGSMNRFRCQPDRPDVRIEVRRAPQTDATRGRRLFRSGGLWDLWQVDDELLFRFISPAMGPLPYKTARFDRDFAHGTIEIDDRVPAYAAASGSLNPFEYPLDELTVVHWLAPRGGIELHACGIADDRQQGWIFVGHSGAGKTTTANGWRGPGTVLSDDRIVVRLEAGQVWMYGTPWHGEAQLSAPGRVPVKGIFLLEQAEEEALVPLAPATAAARLCACSFLPYHGRQGMERTLALLATLVAQVPCQLLHFRRDSDVAALIARRAAPLADPGPPSAARPASPRG
jgi:hypothetical protein